MNDSPSASADPNANPIALSKSDDGGVTSAVVSNPTALALFGGGARVLSAPIGQCGC